MNPDTQNTNPQEPTPSQPQPPVVNPSNKKIIYAILAGIAVLLIILIGLVAALLLKNNGDDKTATKPESSQQSDSANTSTDSKKEVVKTIATDNDKIEILLYAPRQTGSNTTIEYGLHNKCNGCQDKEYASIYDFTGYSLNSKGGAYILDENAGKKYSPIVDADDKVLASDSCSGYIAPGKTIDCFMAFTKVPSGTTVSVVLGTEKIDDVLIK